MFTYIKLFIDYGNQGMVCVFTVLYNNIYIIILLLLLIHIVLNMQYTCILIFHLQYIMFQLLILHKYAYAQEATFKVRVIHLTINLEELPLQVFNELQSVLKAPSMSTRM